MELEELMKSVKNVERDSATKTKEAEAAKEA